MWYVNVIALITLAWDQLSATDVELDDGYLSQAKALDGAEAQDGGGSEDLHVP